MPAAIRLQEEYEDKIQVLFIEVQGASDKTATSFALSKKWLGGNAMWTTELPFRLNLRGIPQVALLSPEGEVVFTGNTNPKIDDAIDDLLKDYRKGPKNLLKSLKDAWKSRGKGDLAGALEKAHEALEKAGTEGEKEAIRDFIAGVDASIDRTLARATWLLDNGYPLEAEELLEGLAKSVKGLADREASVAELLTRLDSPEMKTEIDAEKALAKIEKKLFADGSSDKHSKALTKLAEKYSGTKIAERAAELSRIVSG